MGSSPTASAPKGWAHGPTGRHQLRTLEIRVQLPVSPLNMVLWPSGEGSSPTKSGSVVRVHPGLLWRCPDTPTGRATRLKPECLQVRLLLWVLRKQRLGRQLADHLGLEPGILWVRLPPEPLQHNTSSRSSQECSPRRQRGDRGFKSHRGRSDTWHGTQTGKAAKLKPW